MTAAPRDQASKVYAAEEQFIRILDRQYDYPIIELAGSSIVVPMERKFGQLTNIEAYLEQVCKSLGMVPPHVRERKGQSRAHYELDADTIAIPTLNRWFMRESVVLHELAHARTIRQSTTDHDWQFCQELLELIGRMMGIEAKYILQVLMMEQGVDLFAIG